MPNLHQAGKWPDRLVVWQEALDCSWKPWLENAFLRLAHFLTWTYVAVVVVVWCLLYLAGDRWWGATLLLFGPRWLGLLPVLALVPLNIVVRPRLLRPIVVVSLIFIFGVMDFRIPWPWHSLAFGRHRRVSLLTCNLDGGRCRWERFDQLLYEAMPDVIALQEVDGDIELPFPKNWHVVREGEFVIASRYPIRDVQTWYRLEPPVQWPPLLAVYAVIDLPDRPVSLCNVHLTSPQQGITETLDRHTVVNINRTSTLKQLNELRQCESASLSAWISQLPHVDVLLGDLNLPVESRIYRQWWSNYRNAFGEAGFGLGYTRWVRFHNLLYGARIDHVLTSRDWLPVRCWVGRDIGSDHLPVIAEECWSGPGM
jgi:vancomycin resistance protein VanJ